MTARPSVLYFGNDWFAENRTSSHHVALRLAERFDVYYVECPGLRAPRMDGRDLRKTVRKLARALKPPQSVSRDLPDPAHPLLHVATLLQLPWRRFALMRLLNAVAGVAAMRWLMWRAGITRPIVWCTIPHASFLLGRLGERMSVYYCIDDYASLPDVDADAVRRMDEAMATQADVVFVASETLLASKRAQNPRTYLSPHGVDVDHFARAQDPALEIPADIASLPRPIVGFYGLIERWIDLDLVAWLAGRRPGWSFVMIGRVAVPPEQLPKFPNVHFIGPRPYSSLPAYGKAFDAAIIPYRPTPQVFHSNSLKLREYLAMGKPIVSVPTPQIQDFADVVRLADSPEHFLACLDEAMSAPSTDLEIRARMARVAGDTWDARVSRAVGIARGIWRSRRHLTRSARGAAAALLTHSES